ncbi:hypothetical protein BDA99DRAFT_516583, partial [Phascolomyces articulosus]
MVPYNKMIQYSCLKYIFNPSSRLKISTHQFNCCCHCTHGTYISIIGTCILFVLL